MHPTRTPADARSDVPPRPLSLTDYLPFVGTRTRQQRGNEIAALATAGRPGPRTRRASAGPTVVSCFAAAYPNINRPCPESARARHSSAPHIDHSLVIVVSDGDDTAVSAPTLANATAVSLKTKSQQRATSQACRRALASTLAWDDVPCVSPQPRKRAYSGNRLQDGDRDARNDRERPRKRVRRRAPPAATSADKFVATIGAKPLDNTGDPVHLVVYTDGNHFRETPSKGYGIYARYGGRGYAHAQHVDPACMFALFALADHNVIDRSSPVMELAAAVHVLLMLVGTAPTGKAIGGHFKRVTICSECKDVAEWIADTRQCHTDYIRHFVLLARRAMSCLERRGTHVTCVRSSRKANAHGSMRSEALAKNQRHTSELDCPFADLFGADAHARAMRDLCAPAAATMMVAAPS